MNSEIMRKVYLDAQANCGLKVGDYVKVIRKADDFEGGWADGWIDGIKSPYIGKVGRITHITNNEIAVSHDESNDYGYNYPYFVLEKVEKPAHEFKPFEKVLVRNNNISVWLPDFFYRKAGNVGFFMISNTELWIYCIPYEGNEHLLGTTDAPQD